MLGVIGDKSRSLRYAIQLMTPAKLVAETQGRDQIVPEDISQVDD
jgi:RuvB-like protein 1 (pontin 52)